MGFLFYILFIVCAIAMYYSLLRHRRRKPEIYLTFSTNDIKIKGVIKMVTMKVTQFVEGILQPVDRLGNPAQVEAGTVQFTSSDEAVFVVARTAEDELKVKLVATGVGVAQLDYSADADLGEGVVTITGFTGIEITAEQAVGFAVSFGEPQDQ